MVEYTHHAAVAVVLAFIAGYVCAFLSLVILAFATRDDQ